MQPGCGRAGGMPAQRDRHPAARGGLRAPRAAAMRLKWADGRLLPAACPSSSPPAVVPPALRGGERRGVRRRLRAGTPRMQRSRGAGEKGRWT